MKRQVMCAVCREFPASKNDLDGWCRRCCRVWNRAEDNVNVAANLAYAAGFRAAREAAAREAEIYDGSLDAKVSTAIRRLRVPRRKR